MTDEPLEASEPATEVSFLPTEAEVAFVSGLLAQLPRPEVPAQVAARTEATLAELRAGAALNNTVPIRRRRVIPYLAAAAAVVLFGGIGLQALNGRQAASPVSAASANSSLDQIGTAVTMQLAAAPTTSFGQTRVATPENSAVMPATSASATPTAGNAVAPLAVSALTVPGTFAATTAGLEACLRALGKAGSIPQLVTAEQLAGAPAVAIALPGSAAGTSDLYVVGTNCSEGAAHLLGHLTLRVGATPADTAPAGATPAAG